MSMTESENIQVTFEDARHCVKAFSGEGRCEECRLYPLCGDTFCYDTARIILNAFEEFEQYRAIGTVSEFRETMFFKKYFMELYGEGLEVANWHLNGDLELLDNFIDEAVERGKQEESGEHDE